MGIKACPVFILMLIVPLVLPTAGAALQATTPACASDSCWNQVGPAQYSNLFGAYYSIAITFVSSFNSTTFGIVFAAMHNAQGQTVEISTASLEIAAEGNGTAYPIVFGLPAGQYSASIFAVASYGVAISFTTVVAFTVSD